MCSAAQLPTMKRKLAPSMAPMATATYCTGTSMCGQSSETDYPRSQANSGSMQNQAEQQQQSDREWLAQRFEEHRPRLRGVAYRMLGSLNEADDAVQDAWLRLSRSDDSDIDNLGGWLTTVVARVCLNML